MRVAAPAQASRTTPQPASVSGGLLQRRSVLRLGTPEETYEREADRAADAVVGGKRPPGTGLSLSRIPVTHVQREDGAPKKTEDEKYKQTAEGLGEAFLPGTPEARRQHDEDEALKRAAFSGVGALSELGGPPTRFAGLAEHHSASPLNVPTPSFGYRLRPLSLIDEDLKLRTLSKVPFSATDQKKNEEDHAPAVQRKASAEAEGGFAPAVVSEVVSSPGQPLDGPTRHFMERRFGHDFSQVRVHTDIRAGVSARAVGALAYAVGTHIVFAPGRYMPGASSGRHLLAHELTHALAATQL